MMDIVTNMMATDLAHLILRLVVGLIFIGHGLQKLAGWFGGHGIEGTGGWYESLGLRPGRFWATVAGLFETLGGLGFVLGLFTGIAALAIIAVMLVAILSVHAPKGLWVTNGGYEYNLVMIAAAIALGLAGPGAWALDTLYNLPGLTTEQFGLGLLAVLAGAIVIDFLRRARVPHPQT